jgi:hypothetical protein
MASQGESTVSPLTISQRAEALDKAEKAAATKQPETKEPVKTEETVTEPTQEVKEPVKAEEKKVEVKKPEVKTEAKKVPNDPDELRKWNTRVAQENAKVKEELRAIKAEQEKVYKLLSSMSKKPIDYKELAKNPDAIQKLVEEEKENATQELKERLDALSTEAKAKDTALERMKREHDSENYPEWNRVFPTIVKLAQGPTGQGDPRIDYTKPAGEVLDALYELALKESPAPVTPPAPPTPVEKTYTESDFKSALADALAKEKEAISKAAREEAVKEAQKALAEETKGGTIAGVGKGAGRVPSDHLAAFKKMSLSEQRDWLIQQQQA